MEIYGCYALLYSSIRWIGQIISCLYPSQGEITKEMLYRDFNYAIDQMGYSFIVITMIVNVFILPILQNYWYRGKN